VLTGFSTNADAWIIIGVVGTCLVTMFGLLLAWSSRRRLMIAVIAGLVLATLTWVIGTVLVFG
jgi:uncharacterized membrane protein